MEMQTTINISRKQLKKQPTYAFSKTGLSQIKKSYCTRCKISGKKRASYNSYSHQKPAL